MIILAVLAALIVVCTGGYLWHRAAEREKRAVWRAERKVEARGLILRADIETLMRARSPLLPDAMELRRRQTEEHGHPESNR